MPKILGISVSPTERKIAIVGIAGIGALGVLWAMSGLISPGRKHGPIPSPIPPWLHMGGGGPPPMAHPPMHPGAGPMRAHLANITPPPGPPGRSTLGVGGRIAGGIGSGGGMHRWPSGRIGHPGGYGVAGGYYAYT
jgi:hypothetical protein